MTAPTNPDSRHGHSDTDAHSWRQRNRIGLSIAVVGLIATASISWGARKLDDDSEHRLLQVQTRQAASVLSSAISALQAPLRTALDVAAATNGDATRFTRLMSAYVGPKGVFVSASLWRPNGTAPIASAGVPITQPSDKADVGALVTRAVGAKTFVVNSVPFGSGAGIGYAMTSPQAPGFVVYAKRAIPASRRVPVESDSAFSDLHFATYLGLTTTPSALQTSDLAANRLPIRGGVSERIPFGDSSILLVASRARHLGGSLGNELPWILLIAGLILTGAATMVAVQLTRQRGRAEDDANTITSLYQQVDGLYREQRTIAESLQHALIPKANPSIPSVEIASRYVAGTRGVDIGGDWFSTVQIDPTHFAFVVGDVSGRGVDAAALMARIRFTLSAYLVEGHPPEVALQLCSELVDLGQDGHFATVLVGVADLSSREVVLANAGHPAPMVVSERQAHFVDTAIGLPLGVNASNHRATSYPTTRITMPAGSTLLAFTDGLVERRTEDIDEGLQRLAEAATTTDQPLEDVLTHVLSVMAEDGADDDIAMLAFRWTAARVDATSVGVHSLAMT